MIFSKNDHPCQAVNGIVSKLLIPEEPKEHSASFLHTGPGPFGPLIPTQILSMGYDCTLVASSMCSGNGFVTHVSRCHLAPCNVRHFLSWMFPEMANHSTSTSHSGLSFCVEVCDAGMTWGGAVLLQLSRGANRGRRGLSPRLWESACTLSPKATLPGVDGALDLCPCIKHLSGRAADAKFILPRFLHLCVCLPAVSPRGGILNGLHK